MCATAVAERTIPLEIYSAHDSTVFSMLAVLYASETAHLAHFASSLRLELWGRPPPGKESGQNGLHKVKMFYDDTPLATELCQKGVCDWKMFRHMVKKHLVTPKECEAPGKRHGADDDDRCCDD